MKKKVIPVTDEQQEAAPKSVQQEIEDQAEKALADLHNDPVPDSRHVANVALSSTRQATEAALAAAALADATFRGLLDAASTNQLDPRIHSAEWIQRSHDTAVVAFESRREARALLIKAWDDQAEAESTLLEMEYQHLLDERRKYEPES